MTRKVNQNFSFLWLKLELTNFVDDCSVANFSKVSSSLSTVVSNVGFFVVAAVVDVVDVDLVVGA